MEHMYWIHHIDAQAPWSRQAFSCLKWIIASFWLSRPYSWYQEQHLVISDHEEPIIRFVGRTRSQWEASFCWIVLISLLRFCGSCWTVVRLIEMMLIDLPHSHQWFQLTLVKNLYHSSFLRAHGCQRPCPRRFVTALNTHLLTPQPLLLSLNARMLSQFLAPNRPNLLICQIYYHTNCIFANEYPSMSFVS